LQWETGGDFDEAPAAMAFDDRGEHEADVDTRPPVPKFDGGDGRTEAELVMIRRMITDAYKGRNQLPQRPLHSDQYMGPLDSFAMPLHEFSEREVAFAQVCGYCFITHLFGCITSLGVSPILRCFTRQFMNLPGRCKSGNQKSKSAVDSCRSR
jgi:hypothetical protein